MMYERPEHSRRGVGRGVVDEDEDEGSQQLCQQFFGEKYLSREKRFIALDDRIYCFSQAYLFDLIELVSIFLRQFIANLTSSKMASSNLTSSCKFDLILTRIHR